MYIVFSTGKSFFKRFLKYGGTSGTSGTNPYEATITHGPLLSRCPTTERSARRKMEKEKEKPTENTIEEFSSSLVWTAKVRGSRAANRGSACCG